MPDRMIVITFRVPAPTVGALDTEAARHGLARSDYLRLLIAAALTEKGDAPAERQPPASVRKEVTP